MKSSVSVACATLFVTGISIPAASQGLSGDNARDISRVISPPITQLNNLRNVMTVTAVRNLNTGIAKNPNSPSGQVTAWHGLALNLLAVDHVPQIDKYGKQIHLQQYGPHRASYALAMIHIAMFEVANAFSKKPHHYTSWIDAQLPDAVGVPPSGSSEAAAIVEAAYRVMAHLYPSFKDDLSKERDEAIKEIGNGQDVINGKAYGAKISALVIGIRANDNSALPEPRWNVDFSPKQAAGTPGQWQIDPVSQINVALGANWGKVTPFVLKAANEFKLPGPPPADTNNPKYKQAFEQVRDRGGDDSHNIRRSGSDDEKFYAKFWSYDGTAGLCAPARLYNQIADQVLEDNIKVIAPDATDDMSPEGAAELSRYYALFNLAMVDAGIAAWSAKYEYQYWRPVSGIRAEQSKDQKAGNSGIEDVRFDRREVWYPLGAQTTNSEAGFNITPPFPSYPSGHAVFGSALFEVLREVVSHDNGFKFQSDEFNGKSSLGPNIDAYNYIRCKQGDDPNVSPLFCNPTVFKSFTEAEENNSKSRVWMGVHWAFDADDGEELGRKIGTAVVARAFKRVP